MDDFMLRALFAGLGVAAITGPLGAFVVWRRMAYFGDTLSHSALLGVALGLLLGLSPNLGVVLVSAGLAVLLAMLQQWGRLASDTLLGIFSHSALSLGLVAIASMPGLRVDLMGYLFGDILAVTATDLVWVYAGGALVLAALAAIWRPLLALTVHEELARVEGAPVIPVRLIFMLLIALVIAVAMKIVGILLITSLLIIPAASARRLARNPEQMAGLAVVFGWLAVGLGLWASLQWDTPTGPSVVVAAAALFLLSQLLPLGRRGPG
jgi:zinc transport system permease protein